MLIHHIECDLVHIGNSHSAPVISVLKRLLRDEFCQFVFIEDYAIQCRPFGNARGVIRCLLNFVFPFVRNEYAVFVENKVIRLLHIRFSQQLLFERVLEFFAGNFDIFFRRVFHDAGKSSGHFGFGASVKILILGAPFKSGDGKIRQSDII